MAKRKPQINFQVEEPLKRLYDETREQGHWVARFCAAGFLLMVEDPAARAAAISRLREWEEQFESATPRQIRDFVAGAQNVLERSSRGTAPKRSTRAKKKTAKRK